MTKKGPVDPELTRGYRPKAFEENSWAIAEGDLQVLVEYLDHVGTALLHGERVETSLGWEARFYAAALQHYLSPRERGRPAKRISTQDAFNALRAVHEYRIEEKKGDRSLELIEAAVIERYAITRALFRLALANKLPGIELPGIPRAGK